MIINCLQINKEYDLSEVKGILKVGMKIRLRSTYDRGCDWNGEQFPTEGVIGEISDNHSPSFYLWQNTYDGSSGRYSPQMFNLKYSWLVSFQEEVKGRMYVTVLQKYAHTPPTHIAYTISPISGNKYILCQTTCDIHKAIKQYLDNPDIREIKVKKYGE